MCLVGHPKLDVQTRFLSFVLFGWPCLPIGHLEVKNMVKPQVCKQEVGEFNTLGNVASINPRKGRPY